MRPILIATAALAGFLAAAPAKAQVDRYGGVGTYAQPVPQPQSSRVLTWGGKTIPPQSPPQYGGYGYPGYVQSRPAYGAQLQPAPYAQSRGAPPAPYAADRRAAMYAQPQAPYGYAPQPQAAAPQQPYYSSPAQAAYPQPAYPRAAYPQPPQQAQATFTQPYQPQPYYAPAPGAPAPPPGSTATAPNGVYPTNTVPPQLAGPGSLPPQVAQPLVNSPQAPAPAPPTSIYAPPPQASIGDPASLPAVLPDPTDPRQPQRVAMNTAAPPQTARYYSLHRQFGLQPDPTPALPSDAGAQTVELVSSIDSGVGAEPPSEPRNRIVRTNGKAGTAVLRGARDADPDDN